MKLLIVEDEEHVSEALNRRLSRSKPSIEISVTRSRSSAVDALRRYEFDFIVCDLKLPPNDGGLDANVEHGFEVHSVAKDVCPGTPSMFFTGYGMNQNVMDELAHGPTHDVLGTGENYPMTQLVTKDDFLTCVDYLETFNAELAKLEAISLEPTGTSLSLDRFESRALQLQARSLGGTKIIAESLGGLSGAKALKVTIQDHQDLSLGAYFAKIDERNELSLERENYHEYVLPQLDVGFIPAMGSEIDAGIGKRQALFYQLARRYSESLFDVLVRSEGDAVDAVKDLRGVFKPWTHQSVTKKVRIRDLRAERISDAALQPHRQSLGSTEYFEGLELESATGLQHGDLHGLNVLCDADGPPVVVDFGNVRHAPICIDPVSLELSVLFHPESPFRSGAWPTENQTEAWFNLDRYLRNCPIPEFIKECRLWAHETSNSESLSAAVYAEAVRQLKFPDSDHERALSIGRSALGIRA